MKKTIYKAFFASAITLFATTEVSFSQTNFEQVPKPVTPQAASLIRSVRYPVGYNTGAVDVTIPLHEITVGGVTIPITMSYNTKGIRVSELDRSFGIGWTLNAEPMVVQSVRGKPDLRGYYSDNDINWFDGSVRNRKDYLYNLHTGGAEPDINPDEYIYKLLGSSGSFFHKYEWGTYSLTTVPYDPIKIDLIGDIYRSTPTTMKITDDKGVVYDFSVVERTILGNKWPETKTWKVSSIKLNGSTSAPSVTFNYTPLKVNDNVRIISDYSVVEDVSSTQPPPGGYWIDGTCYYNEHNITPVLGFPRITNAGWTYSPHLVPSFSHPGHDSLHVHQTSGEYIPTANPVDSEHHRQLLSSIVCDQGNVTFERNASTGLLNMIQVTSTAGVLVKQICFSYSTVDYSNKISNIPYYRLNLVEILDGSGKIVDKYSFAYYPNQTQFQSITTNFWDYINSYGSQSTGSHVAHTQPRIYHKNENRVLSSESRYELSIGGGAKLSSAIQNGVLESITNILGGKTTFEYEGDTYLKYERTYSEDESTFITRTVHGSAGGLRVKAITEFDPKTQSEYRREIKYGATTNRGVESGVGKIRTQIYPESYMHLQYRMDGLSTRIMSRIRTYYSSLSTNASFGGSPIVYDTVTEYRKMKVGSSWRDVSKTVYTYFYNFTTNNINSGICLCQDDHPGARVDCQINDSWMYGHLISKTEYVKSEDGYKLVSRISNVYSPLNAKFTLVQNTDQRYVRDIPFTSLTDASNAEIIKGGSSAYYGMLVFNATMWTDGCVRKMSDTTLVYDETTDQYLSTIRTYTYNNKNYYLTSSTTNTSQTSFIEEFEYADQSPGHALNSYNMFSVLLKKTNTFQDNSSTSLENDYDSFSGDDCPRIKKSYVNHGMYRYLKVEYKQYDKWGNPIYIVKNGTDDIVYLWGHNGQYMVAEIRNATASDVASALGVSAQSLSESRFNSYGQLNGLRSMLPGALITTYDYRPLIGLISTTDPSGRKVDYTYDGAARLVKVTDDKGKPVEAYEYNIQN